MADETGTLVNLLSNFRRIVLQPEDQHNPMFLNTMAFRAGEIAVHLRRSVAHQQEVGAEPHDIADLIEAADTAALLERICFQRAGLAPARKE